MRHDEHSLVCKLDWGYYIIKVIYEINQRVLITFPDKKYIIYKAYPDYDMVCPLCLIDESFFKSSHVRVVQYTIWYRLKIPRFNLYCFSERTSFIGSENCIFNYSSEYAVICLLYI